MKKIYIYLVISILLIGIVSAVCTATYDYSGQVLTIDSGSTCSTAYPIYILYALLVIGDLTLSHNVLFHKTGTSSINDLLIVKSSGTLKIDSGKQISSTDGTSQTCKYPYTGTVGCPNRACMECVCNTQTVPDPFCCGDSGGGTSDLGFWDSVCNDEFLDLVDAESPDCIALC